MLFRSSRSKSGGGGGGKPAMPAGLDEAAQGRYQALRNWRAQVARAHNLPAYVVFHDAVLADMARIAPSTLGELGQISGVGAKKLQAYGQEILDTLAA